jgi:hypothetical protein
MRRINNIAKSLDRRRLTLAACRRSLQQLIQAAQANTTLNEAISRAAFALDQQCCASMKDSIELYHALAEFPDDLLAQVRATANLITARTRISREHQLIVSITAPLIDPKETDQPGYIDSARS